MTAANLMRQRNSIERRFVVSILWVGVIPMALALIIGYVVAREAQRVAVLQTLSTAAGKTADGIRLALEERKTIVTNLCQSGAIQPLLTSGDPADLARAKACLESLKPPERGAFLYFNRLGKQVLSTRTDPFRFDELPERYRVRAAAFVDYHFDPQTSAHQLFLSCPIFDRPAATEPVGWMVEQMDPQPLMQFILGSTARPASQRDRYEIIVREDSSAFCVRLEPDASGEKLLLQFSPLHPSLAQYLDSRPDAIAGSLFIWRYKSLGALTPVLLAFQRILPDAPVFIAVHRPTPQVFSVITGAAIITFVISNIIIGLFCIGAYRFVNNTIIRPVSLLNEGAQIIRQGDLELKLRIDTGDEIEELASSFNQMAAALRENLGRLQESEEKYRGLVNAMRDGLFRTDASGRVLFINPAGARMLGFSSEEEALGTDLAELFEDEEVFRALLEESFSGLTAQDVRRAWMHSLDGTAICLELRGSRSTDASGHVTGFEGTFRDVTRSVLLEREAAERAERINVINQIANAVNSSLEVGKVFESIALGIRRLVSFDYASISLRIGHEERFETRVIWPVPEPDTPVFPRLDGPGSCAAIVCAKKAPLLVDNIRMGGGDLEFQFPDAIHSVLSIPLFAGDTIIGTVNLGAREPGAFTTEHMNALEALAPHLAAALRNAQLLEHLRQSLEEVTRAREKLRQANEELKSLDEMKTNLLSNVSHELRTPLVAVMGYTDMVLNGKAGPINDRQKEYLAIAQRNVERLVTLIENLLDFSRLHRGTENLVFTRFDLVECVRASMESVKPAADGREITMTLSVLDRKGNPHEGPVVVEGDRGQLGQVFNNLLFNAVKFNKPSGRIDVTLQLREKNVAIAVSDTGIGIPEEAMDKLFTRFFQVDGSSTRKYGGTGIGLAISQDIVRLHGSRITVTSRVGEGSTFRFTLPLYEGELRERSGAGSLDSPFETKLLIELLTQDRALAAQVRNMLLPEGMDLLHAAYPDVAVQVANRYVPDCLIIDTDTGPPGGVVIEEYLNNPARPDIPVVLLTGDDSLYQQYRLYISSRIRKNFRKSSLLSGIYAAINRSEGILPHLGRGVLCVDDDPEVMRRCLDEEGFTVKLCSDGDKALVLAATQEYSVVLLDIAMPGLDGIEVCRRLKSNPDLKGIKVYFVTAVDMDSFSREFQSSGADGILQKPFSAHELLHLVSSCLSAGS